MRKQAKKRYHTRLSWEGSPVEAFYNEEGKLVSTTRYISQEQLPEFLRKTLQLSYPEYALEQIAEQTDEQQTSYLISVGNEKEILLLRFEAIGECRKIGRIKKKR